MTLDDLLGRLADALRREGATLATAESCTGGLIAAACTSLAGSSDWFDRGFVTYSNAAKVEVLGVDGRTIDAHGAVSAPVATAMAEGALKRSRASYAVAVTGVAGPGGGTAEKPVGTVWVGIARASRSPAVTAPSPESHATLLRLAGDRREIRDRTVVEALSLLFDSLASERLPG